MWRDSELMVNVSQIIAGLGMVAYGEANAALHVGKNNPIVQKAHS